MEDGWIIFQPVPCCYDPPSSWCITKSKQHDASSRDSEVSSSMCLEKWCKESLFSWICFMEFSWTLPRVERRVKVDETWLPGFFAIALILNGYSLANTIYTDPGTLGVVVLCMCSWPGSSGLFRLAPPPPPTNQFLGSHGDVFFWGGIFFNQHKTVKILDESDAFKEQPCLCIGSG